MATALFDLVRSVWPTRKMVPLNVVKVVPTPNGFIRPPRGWNSWGLQGNPAISPSFVFDQSHVIEQADELVKILSTASSSSDDDDYYISLDSGWSIGDHGDEHGRITFETAKFDIPKLAQYVHSRGLKLGVYVLPGAFTADRDKLILGTEIRIGDTFSGNENGFARSDFSLRKDGVQEWHNSVVHLFAEWGVDLIKLDYITPGSPQNGGHLPYDNTGSVIAYHKAIQSSGRKMRLDISWKLSRKEEYFKIWSSNADSMRTDQDLNNSNSHKFIRWATVQRAIDNYRDFISRVVVSRHGPTLSIHPDMDNLFVGNEEELTGVTDRQRETIMTHWIGASANLIIGSDLTRFDALGIKLLTDPHAKLAADFTARFPMQPRNPGSGRGCSRQLQAWVAGPEEGGHAIVVLANYGPDEGQGGYGTKITGPQVVTASWDDLGLHGEFEIYDIWRDQKFEAIREGISSCLDVGESLLLRLKPTTSI